MARRRGTREPRTQSQVRKLTELRRQTNDKIAITVFDTTARCVPRVTGGVVDTVVDGLGVLPKDMSAADVGRQVRELQDNPGRPQTPVTPLAGAA